MFKIPRDEFMAFVRENTQVEHADNESLPYYVYPLTCGVAHAALAQVIHAQKAPFDVLNNTYNDVRITLLRAHFTRVSNGPDQPPAEIEWFCMAAPVANTARVTAALVALLNGRGIPSGFPEAPRLSIIALAQMLVAANQGESPARIDRQYTH